MSDNDLEILELVSNCGGSVSKSRRSGSEGYCRCKEGKAGSDEAPPEENTEEINREANWVLCIGEDAEDEHRSLEGPALTETTESGSEESEHDTDSDFLPTDAEVVSEGTCTTFETEEGSSDGTGDLQEEAADDIDKGPVEVQDALHF